jgi:PTH1 family peptidyl-tRNA hydrolase
MNESGVFVKKLVDQYKLEPSNLYIAHDDLDIPLGAYKIQLGVGPKVHNGVNSVEEELGTKDFWRVRIGVDNRKPDDRTSGEEYVLQDFTAEERKALDGVIQEICKKLVTL